MAEVQILKVSRKTDRIMDFFLANPLATLREAELELGYTQSWLSVVINSDAYQAAYRRRRALTEDMVANDIGAHLRAAALTGLQKTEKLMTTSDNLEQVGNTTEKLLGALGYTPKSPMQVNINQTNNVLNGQVPETVFQRAKNAFNSLVSEGDNLNALPPADAQSAFGNNESGEGGKTELVPCTSRAAGG